MRWPADEPFWIGVNLPWLNYGGDFGANRWQPAGGVGQPGRRAALREALGRLADSGATRVRWFMLADGRAGLLESASGDVAGLDDHVLRDADAALDELERAGLKAIFVLFDYHWFKRGRIVDGVRTGGRRALAIDPALRRRLIDLVVDPLLVHCGRHPAISAWDVVNEPEWVTRGTRLPPRPSEVPRAAMRAFIRDVVGAVHHRTSHAATVGSASTRTLPLVEGLGLDVYQAHWYDRLEKPGPARSAGAPASASTARSSSASSRPGDHAGRRRRSSRRRARPAMRARSPGRRWPTTRRRAGARWRRGCLTSRRTPR